MTTLAHDALVDPIGREADPGNRSPKAAGAGTGRVSPSAAQTRLAYGLAVAGALAGRDPRPAIAEARRLNPLEPIARDLERGLRSDDPRRWRRVAARAKLPGG